MILDELFACARVRAGTLDVGEPRRASRASFAAVIAGKSEISVIAEFKRKSPSRGDLAPSADVAQQALIYAGAGAAAMSVLTEPSRFAGDVDDLRTAAKTVELPLLMKDFIVDRRQIVQAANLGASAVLLIVRGLAQPELICLAQACRELLLTPLVECHDAAEIERALAIEDAVIGVNNRDLETLEIDLTRAPRLLRQIPSSRVAVAESGYTRPDELAAVKGLADAVLIGSALMERQDPRAFIEELRQCGQC